MFCANCRALAFPRQKSHATGTSPAARATLELLGDEMIEGARSFEGLSPVDSNGDATNDKSLARSVWANKGGAGGTNSGDSTAVGALELVGVEGISAEEEEEDDDAADVDDTEAEEAAASV